MQASEADYYTVYVHLVGTRRASEPSVVKAWPRQTKAAATLVPDSVYVFIEQNNKLHRYTWVI